MAGKDFALQATPAAVAVIERLRGTARRSYATFESELRKQGCGVAGYRLLGAEDGGYSDYCCKRLVDDWRVITTFEPGVAIVVAVGRHDSHAFYADLSKTLAIGAAGRRREEKPPCCGKGGWRASESVSGDARVGVPERLTPKFKDWNRSRPFRALLAGSARNAAYRRTSTRIDSSERQSRHAEISCKSTSSGVVLARRLA